MRKGGWGLFFLVRTRLYDKYHIKVIEIVPHCSAALFVCNKQNHDCVYSISINIYLDTSKGKANICPQLLILSRFLKKHQRILRNGWFVMVRGY